MPTLFIRPPAPTPKPESPLIPASSLPAVPATPRRVGTLRPSTPQTHGHTFCPVGRDPSTAESTANTSRMPYKLYDSDIHCYTLRPAPSTISAPTITRVPSSPSFPITSTPSTTLPGPSLLGPALSSRTVSFSSSPTHAPKPKVTYAHKQARKLIRSVRRMHAQICVAKLSVLDESVRRDVAGLKREVIGFLNTAHKVYFYLTTGDESWTFDADFSRMAMITGKWFKLWRGVREQLESRSKRKGKRYEIEDEDGYGDGDTDGPF